VFIFCFYFILLFFGLCNLLIFHFCSSSQACVGQESCTIDVSEDTFSSTTCGDDVIKTLSVEAIC